jgi:hypothetical protein
MNPLPPNAYFTEDSYDDDNGPATVPSPTVPHPVQSEIRIKVPRQKPVVDFVTADLELDPRSEEYLGDTVPGPKPQPLLGLLPPPAHSLPAPNRSGPMPVGVPTLTIARSTVVSKPKKTRRSLRRRAG